MKKLKLWSDIIATWVAVVGAFIGGVFALIEYSNKSSGERVKMAIEYVDRFNKDPLLKARTRIEEIWNNHAESVFEKTKSGDKEFSDFVVKTIRENKLNGDTILIIEFFENLHACIYGRLCDQITANRFFGKYSFDFYGLLFPFLAEQRQRLKDKSFGHGVESLAKSHMAGRAVEDVWCRSKQ